MKKLFLLLVLGLVVYGLSGCGTMQRLLNTDSSSSFGGLLKNNNSTPTAAGTQDQTTSAPVVEGDGVTVTLYFADSSGQKLVSEKRQIPKTLSVARETLNELFKGPANGSKLLAVVPEGTTLLDINISNETATVDISKDIDQPLDKVSSDLTVNAIVNTLTQFSTVKQVKFRVEGQAVTSIDGASVEQTSASNSNNVEVHPITQLPVSDGLSSVAN